MPKESTIQHYSSSTTGNIPAAIDLATGELAINIADEKVFLKNLGGSVVSLSQTKDLSGTFAAKNQTVTSFNGSTGAVNFYPALATSSVTGVASFNTTDFTVTTGAVALKGVVTSLNGLTGARTLTGDGGALQGVAGTAITSRLATTSATGVASFNATRFSVVAGAVDLAAPYQITGDTVAAVGSASVTRSGNIATIDNRLATTSLTGVASFSSTNFDVASGAVSIKTGGVPNAALANSSFTLRDEVGGTDTISLGDTLTITGGRGVDFIRTTTDTYEVRGVTATSSVLGVASFNATRFSVVNGAVDLAAPYQITGDTVAAVGSASVTRSGNIATINNRLATTSLTGVASFSSTNFDVASGAVSIKNVVTTFNGASGAINYYPPIATVSATGVASFNTNDFTVSAAGAVSIKGSVTSVNGATGTITNVAVTNATNNFTAIQAFPNGLSAQGATFAGMVSVADFLARTVGGDEGGEIKLGLAQTNTTLTGNAVTIDVYQNRLRIFESGGSARGYYMDLSAGSAGAGSQLASSTPYSPPLATTSVTGVASFNGTRFTVTNGAVDLAAPYQITGQTVVSGGGSQLVSTSGNTVTIDNRLATTSLTGVASFSSTNFDVAAGAVSIKTGGVPNTALANSSFTLRDEVGGTDTISLGDTLTITGGRGVDFIRTTTDTYEVRGITATSSVLGVASFNATRFSVVNGAVDLAAPYQITGDTVAAVGSASVTRSGNIATIDNRLATTSLTGVASFSSTNFDVASGAVSIKTGGVPNTALANSSFTLRDEVGGTDTISLGDTLTITGGRGVDFIRTTTDTYEVRGVTATSSVLGVASFNATRFSVSNGAVDLAAPYQITGDTVAAVGSASVTRSGNVATIDNRLATTSLTGVASFSSTNFDVASGAVSIKTGGVPNAALANSSFTLRDEVGGTDTISLGDTLTITGGRGVDFIRTTTDTYEVRGITATSSVLGVASFNATRFSVVNGAVDLAAPYQITGDTVAAVGSASVTRSGNIATIDNRLATSSLTGVASFNSSDFTVSAGAVSLTNAARTNAANTFTGLQTFSGGLSGNLTGAATLATIENTNAGTRYICMVGGTGQTGIFVDAVTTPLSYQPAIGRMSMSSLVVTGSGYFTTINSSSIDANSQLVFNGPDGGAFTSVNNDAWLYFDVPNGDISFGDINGSTTGLLYAFTPKLNLGVLSSQNAGNVGKAKFGINRDGNGWTASGYGIELGRDNGKMLRMVYTDSITKQSDASPTANATFELSNNGDLTIKPSGGDVNISGSLTVTGTGLSGNVVINNQLNVLGGATFAASTDVYFGGASRGLIINGGKGSSDIAAYGNTEINIDGYLGNGTVSLRGYIINMGDIDGTVNSTYIQVDDSGSTISHEASLGHNFGGSRINALSGITAASLYISGGATFDGNTTIGNAATDTTTIYGSKVVNEFVFNNGTARTVGLSWANGNVQLLGGTGSGATGVTAIYFTNAPATGSASITLIVTNGGNMTGNTNFWATNIKWPGGNKPTLTASGVDVVSFVTPDAGSTIYGFVGGLNFA